MAVNLSKGQKISLDKGMTLGAGWPGLGHEPLQRRRGVRPGCFRVPAGRERQGSQG